MADEQGFTYKKAGVDVEAGNRAVELMKQRLKSTENPLVLGGLGGFGGAMRLPRLKDPVLVVRHRRRGHQDRDRPRAWAGWTPSASTSWP